MTQLVPVEPFASDPAGAPWQVLPTAGDVGLTTREFYLELVDLRLKVISHFVADERLYLVAEARDVAPSERERLSERERDVFCRLLAGQAQKATSIELGLSQSTVATHCARAFAKLHLNPDPYTVPLALVIITQAAYGAVDIANARVTASVRHGVRYVVANISRPPCGALAKLTTAEREVALALLNGSPKSEIARVRLTSVNTIGRQVSSVFSKLNVKGRYELIRRMCD
jgi:DNA-binding NarL/FixJ family response regulator